MNISKTKTDTTLTLALDGRLDTMTAPQLENEVKASLGNAKELVVDMENIAYLSSAGLRVLLSAQKTMNARGGSMIVKNPGEAIMEVFEITGFVDILTIE